MSESSSKVCSDQRSSRNCNFGVIGPILEFFGFLKSSLFRLSYFRKIHVSSSRGFDQSCLGFLVKFETKIGPKTMICAKSFFASNFCGFEYFYFGYSKQDVCVRGVRGV